MNEIQKDRSERKMTQSEYSRLFGVSESCVGKWESGKRTPPDYFFMLVTFKTELLQLAQKKMLRNRRVKG